MDNGRPDAVRVILDPSDTRAGARKIADLQGIFTKTLGADRLYVRNQGGEYFISSDPSDTLRYPPSHQRWGQERYEWIDQAGGCFHGYLRSDQTA